MDIGERIEATRYEAESWKENFYTRTAPGLRAVDLLTSVDSDLWRIQSAAMSAYGKDFGYGGCGITHDGYFMRAGETNRLIREPMMPYIGGSDVATIVISTSRPGERWIIRGDQTIDIVYETVKWDAHCDLNCVPQDYCIRELRAAKNLKHTLPRIVPLVLPFVSGATIILGHVSSGCWQEYVRKNEINLDTIEIFEPTGDEGFNFIN